MLEKVVNIISLIMCSISVKKKTPLQKKNTKFRSIVFVQFEWQSKGQSLVNGREHSS